MTKLRLIAWNTSFISGLLRILFALLANFIVFLLSSMWPEAGVTVQIMQVLAFPPSEFCRIRVSLESR
jgi:hypothetical protein